MPSVGQLTREKRMRATIEHDEGVTIALVFDSNKITPAWVAEAEARDEEKDTQSLPKALASVLLEWDVTQEDGSPYPPTPENLSVFSYPLQAAILTAIMEASIPSRAEGNSSSTDSSASEHPVASSEVSSPTSQNGSEDTNSQTASASQSST